MKQVMGNNDNPNTAMPAAKTAQIPAYVDRPARSEIENYNLIPTSVAPIWPANSSLDISIYVSASTRMPSLSTVPQDSLIMEEKAFNMGNWSESREVDTTFKVPKEVQNNGTLWAHFYVALSGHQLDPAAKDYSPESAVHFLRPLNQYLPKKKVAKRKNLLANAEETTDIEEDNTPKYSIASYYHPNFTVSVIPDFGVANYQQMHPAVRQSVHLESTGARDITGQNTWYYPVMYLNTFWQLKTHMTEVNSTVETLPLRIVLNNLSNWKFNIMASMDEGAKQNARNAASGNPVPGGGDGNEFEMIKEVLLDTNIYLLGTTAIVSVFHMIFETLAFKNDIVRNPLSLYTLILFQDANPFVQSHWRKKKDNVGTSVRTIIANIFMQAVIFLYLIDNNENTSWMVLASQGFGIVLEAWKVTKMVDVRLRPPPQNSFWSFLPYLVSFEDKHKLSETEKKTQEYDEIAFKYLYIIAIPLLGAYAVYSLFYETHKSWYSFIIETLVGSVYAYGFLMMVPSLYINYRLKVSSKTFFPVVLQLLTPILVRCPYARKGFDV
jgi:Cleft lip and palate transmembrane protein 1 (CLPTM1)